MSKNTATAPLAEDADRPGRAAPRQAGKVTAKTTADEAAEPQMSPEEREEKIKARAYELWEASGQPHSDETRDQFWYAAEQEIDGAN